MQTAAPAITNRQDIQIAVPGATCRYRQMTRVDDRGKNMDVTLRNTIFPLCVASAHKTYAPSHGKRDRYTSEAKALAVQTEIS